MPQLLERPPEAPRPAGGAPGGCREEPAADPPAAAQGDPSAARRAGGGAPGRPGSDDVLRVLRPDASRRRAVDPGLSGGLRAWLEDGVASALATAGRRGRPGADVEAAVPVVVDRWALAGIASGDDTPVTVPAARQAMVGTLFRQLVTTGHVTRPFEDALAGLGTSVPGARVVAFVSSLPRATRDAVRRDVVAHGRAMAARWPALPPGWLPRTTTRQSVALAGGRVVLRATTSLALGGPAGARASVCSVDVRVGAPRPAHAADRRLLALVETLCGGAPPCRVATYYPLSGQVDVEDPDDDALASTVIAVIDAVTDTTRRCGPAPVPRP